MYYEKKYKDALERARVWKEKSGIPVDRQGILDNIFPELKESEDERIRNEIIQSIQDNMCVIHKDECIAWLEKQGKRNLTWSKDDENMLNDIIVGLTSMEKLIFTQDVQMKTQIQGRINWLESIKERIKGE